ncbi:hypothetical protein CYMTET_34207 [Cymbomonas tetramitiformis]|uniref:HAT C-terminal dimerisation domain-containing protein n=1 Tax=Cymbomonas tetramitiformis TaxID=36881 RepID=A0AAE0FBI8_9CHLO|nr:hypothetical protein CYMTET_34207 [Cymbomonas tetramitiformis]
MADSDDECEDDSNDQGATTVEAIDEFAAYLALLDVPLDTDLLEWWKLNSDKYPQTARMARQFLTVPASAAGVERAFSKVGRMHSDLRKNLSEGTIEHACMACMNTV